MESGFQMDKFLGFIGFCFVWEKRRYVEDKFSPLGLTKEHIRMVVRLT